MDLKAVMFRQCEAMGETKAREMLAAGAFNDRKKRMVELWLELQDGRRSDSINSEEMRIARSAKNAAWTAAISAVIAIIISIIALYLSWRGLQPSS